MWVRARRCAAAERCTICGLGMLYSGRAALGMFVVRGAMGVTAVPLLLILRLSCFHVPTAWDVSAWQSRPARTGPGLRGAPRPQQGSPGHMWLAAAWCGEAWD